MASMSQWPRAAVAMTSGGSAAVQAAAGNAEGRDGRPQLARVRVADGALDEECLGGVREQVFGCRLVCQPLQPFPQEPRPPLRHHVPGDTEVSCYRAVRPSRVAGQDDPRPAGQRLRGLTPPRPRGQRPPLVIGQVEGNQLRARRCQILLPVAELLTQDTSVPRLKCLL